VVALIVAGTLLGSGTLSQGRLKLGAGQSNATSFMDPLCLNPEEYYKKYTEPWLKKMKEEEEKNKGTEPTSHTTGGTKEGGDGSDSKKTEPGRSGGGDGSDGEEGEGGGTEEKFVIINPGGLPGNIGGDGRGTVAPGNNTGSSTGGGEGDVKEGDKKKEPQKWLVDCGCKRQGFEWDEYNNEVGEVVTYACQQKAWKCADPKWQCPKDNEPDWGKIEELCVNQKKTMCKNEVASFIQSLDKNVSDLCKLYRPDIEELECYQPGECEEYKNIFESNGNYSEAINKKLLAAGLSGDAYDETYNKEFNKASTCVQLYADK